jgi:hypothetical protein
VYALNYKIVSLKFPKKHYEDTKCRKLKSVVLIEDIPLCFSTHNKIVYSAKNTTTVYDTGILIW